MDDYGGEAHNDTESQSLSAGHTNSLRTPIPPMQSVTNVSTLTIVDLTTPRAAEDTAVSEDPRKLKSLQSLRTSFSSSKKHSNSNTLSYWIAVLSIFGGVLYCSASLFWIMDTVLSSNDYYALVTVGYFTGGTSFGCANYLNFFKTRRNEKVRSLSYAIALVFAVGSFLVFWPYLFDVLRIDFERSSLAWHCDRAVYTAACALFFVGGVLCVVSARRAETKDAVSLCVAWQCLVGGLCFFVGALGLYSTDEWILFAVSKVQFLVGSLCYFVVSVIALYRLNARKALFQCLYVLTLATSFTGIVYAGLCAKYKDWMKNFLLAMLVTVAVLAIDSTADKKLEQRTNSKKSDDGTDATKLKYIRYFSRVFMTILTLNLLVDAYHLSQVSGYGCTESSV